MPDLEVARAMNCLHSLQRRLGVILAALAALIACGAAPTAAAQVASPHAIDIPRWFTESFLDFKDEVAEAARSGKRVMVYFGQDGCPYCKALMQANFGTSPAAQKITASTRKHFVAIAMNLWGDREVHWLDGTRGTEKEIARRLAVQFTPTLFFLDTDGRVLLRLSGYQPPERFAAIIDWVAERHDRRESLADYLARLDVSAPLTPPPRGAYLMREPAALARRAGGKPLAVLFESERCAGCAEMHREAFQRPTLKPLLARFDIARLVPGQPARLTTPAGATSEAKAFARDLQITLHPTVVFFDDRGREVFRFDGYMRPFHIESAFDYVASGAYRREPQFQRFVQSRAEALQAAGKPVDLWK
jgi:thioredoxin-related protein